MMVFSSDTILPMILSCRCSPCREDSIPGDPGLNPGGVGIFPALYLDVRCTLIPREENYES